MAATELTLETAETLGLNLGLEVMVGCRALGLGLGLIP